jgi:hypothetical protein
MHRKSIMSFHFRFKAENDYYFPKLLSQLDSWTRSTGIAPWGKITGAQ